INNYSEVKGYRFEKLRCAVNDAKEIAEVLRQHSKSRLYAKSEVTVIPENKATAAHIVEVLNEVAKNVKSDDWFVIFLAGHGHAEMNKNNTASLPGSFFFLCADSNSKKPETRLTSRKLYDLLSDIPCRKLVLLDACRSGAVVSNPLRDLT